MNSSVYKGVPHAKSIHEMHTNSHLKSRNLATSRDAVMHLITFDIIVAKRCHILCKERGVPGILYWTYGGLGLGDKWVVNRCPTAASPSAGLSGLAGK